MADDTIVAPATAPGEAAVAMVRLSGPGALRIASGHFSGKRSPEETPTHRILHGRFHDGSGAPIDTVLLSVFRAPHSYTGEDVVEIASHGGAAVPAAIFEALVRAGARPARPGEFTERAFRNGKLDLAQAEAVAALVRARSDRAARAARATLGGALSRRIERLDGALVELLAEVEARIDFPSEAGERLDGAALAGRCGGIASEIGGWLAGLPGARRGEGGVSVVLAGPPNVGKSSLLNALVGYERAIVSDTPGTTRDTVEASIWLDGVELRMVDTAGLRWSDDPIERLGTERAALALSRSDLAVVVLDRSAPGASVEALAGALGESAPVLVAWNKADLARSRGVGGAGGVPRPEGWSGTALAGTRVLAEVETVAIEPSGADLLRDALREALPSVLSGHAGDEIPTASARQEALLAEAHAALVRAEAALRADESCDLIALDLTDARRALGEIVGRGVDQDVVAAIFARFCIGK
ncbi:MAG TPA: tRNA uridine-5-carboxymethylaminomethyl(34) synthesis GTPase MnmE [Candidatus Limnocylindrales bacterium]|nr:tRNA uridine-5-carboxymethylaminomethyl(34) synthesis GTPase MnmE [Candidatus Limnocylindrales bacterium]